MAQFVEEHWGTGDLLAGLAPGRADDVAFRGWLAKLERVAASPRRAAALVRLMGATDVTAILPQISVPTLVLHRAGDPYVDVRHAHYLAERIPNAQLTIVPGTDHFFTVGDLDSLRRRCSRSSPARRPEIDADRFLTTVLMTDIVGSTRMAARVGDDRWRRLLADHFDACREHVDRHRGEFVKTTGDGMLAIFDGPARAVRCGLAIRDTATTWDQRPRRRPHRRMRAPVGRSRRRRRAHRSADLRDRRPRGGDRHQHGARPRRRLDAALRSTRHARAQGRPRLLERLRRRRGGIARAYWCRRAAPGLQSALREPRRARRFAMVWR